MAGMGPAPKNAATRQRRNASSQVKTIPAGAPELEVPELPKRPRGKKWLAPVQDWWAATWASPMAREYGPADVFWLIHLAELLDDFHRETTKTGRRELLSEIRLQRAAFGQTPMDRRRAGVQVQPGPAGETAAAAAKPTSRPARKGGDPRSLLVALEGGKAEKKQATKKPAGASGRKRAATP